MNFASLFVGANLDSVFRAEKKFFELEVAFFRETLCDKESVVETTSADVFGGSGEGNEDGVLW